MDKDSNILYLSRKTGLNVNGTKQAVQQLVRSARVSQHAFLIYLFALVLEELANIENGRETEF